MTNQITVSWNASLGPVSGYNIRRGTAPGNEAATPLNANPIVGTSFTDKTVVVGQVYSYEVSSVYNGVESKESLGITGEITSVNSPVLFLMGELAIRTHSKRFSLGQVIFDGASYQEVVRAGVSGTFLPSWNRDVGQTTMDGSVEWAPISAAGDIVLLNSNSPQNRPGAPTGVRVSSEHSDYLRRGPYSRYDGPTGLAERELLRSEFSLSGPTGLVERELLRSEFSPSGAPSSFNISSDRLDRIERRLNQLESSAGFKSSENAETLERDRQRRELFNKSH
jgi:hypothetical protein